MNQDDPVKKFNTTILALIVRLERKSRSEVEVGNIDRLKQRMAAAKREMGPQILVTESMPYFLEYQKQILDREQYENMILSLDAKTEYIKRHGPIKSENEFFFSLIDSIRGHYVRGSQKEKDEVYVDVNTLFQACVAYKIQNM